MAVPHSIEAVTPQCVTRFPGDTHALRRCSASDTNHKPMKESEKGEVQGLVSLSLAHNKAFLTGPTRGILETPRRILSRV